MMVSKSGKVWAPRLANRPSRKRPPLWHGTTMLTRGALTGRLISLVNCRFLICKIDEHPYYRRSGRVQAPEISPLFSSALALGAPPPLSTCGSPPPISNIGATNSAAPPPGSLSIQQTKPLGDAIEIPPWVPAPEPSCESGESCRCMNEGNAQVTGTSEYALVAANDVDAERLIDFASR